MHAVLVRLAPERGGGRGGAGVRFRHTAPPRRDHTSGGPPATSQPLSRELTSPVAGGRLATGDRRLATTQTAVNHHR
jgi:hypothetical protein